MSSDEQQQRPPNPNARLRELLSIPERQRTDAQWDEIIEIEISQGPRKPSGNAKPQNQSQFRQSDNRGDRSEKKPPGGGGAGGGGGANKHMRKRRPGGPGGQGGQGNSGGQGGQGSQGGSGGPGGSGSQGG